MSQQKNKMTEWIWIIIIIVCTVIGLAYFQLKGSSNSSDEHQEEDGHDHANESATAPVENTHADGGKDHDEEKPIVLTAKQVVEQGIQFARVELGKVNTIELYPAKIVSNSDEQAHISPSYAGRVEQVHVGLGDIVKKGQTLAVVYTPDLVEQQANLSIAQENLKLSQQDYQREKALFDQGISAKQDYLRAFNAYARAQIEVKALRAKLIALGSSAQSQGRYAIQSPMHGVISKKDLVVGEYVQVSDQILTIDQVGQLWLEFVVPRAWANQLQTGQQIRFQSFDQKIYQARIKSLSPEADTATGQLKIQADVLQADALLKPNVMVNVQLQSSSQADRIRVLKTAVQQVEGKTAVFVVTESKGNISIRPQVVVLDDAYADDTWVAIKSGLSTQQKYVTQGSFLLKSEMEKGEADHGH